MKTIALVLGTLAGVLALGLALTQQSPPSSPHPAPPDHVLTDLVRARAANDAVALSHAWLEAGGRSRAADLMAGALSHSDSPQMLRVAAHEALLAGRWSDAQAAFERLLSLEPENTWAHLNLGLILAAADPAVARPHLESAAAEPALAPLARAVLNASDESAEAVGWALFEREQWPYAELAFTIAAADTRIAPVGLGALALTQDMQERDGSRWMQVALETEPDNASLLALAGMHLRLRGDIEGSLQAWSAAAELAPDSAAIAAQLGVAYQHGGDLEQAQVWLERAVALADDDARYQALLDALTDTEEAALDALVDALDSGAAYSAP